VLTFTSARLSIVAKPQNAERLIFCEKTKQAIPGYALDMYTMKSKAWAEVSSTSVRKARS
jgi:hypothetical protein